MTRPVVETPLTFGCGAAALVGMLHRPEPPPTLGVVIVVGGPQYRVGSHRQFVLLARDLAAAGVAVFRFDCRGMGDSDGVFPGFEAIRPDVAAAVEAMLAAAPSVAKLVLWGLCDAASVICDYAATDPRIAGIALLNPWVRTEAGAARAYLRHYYLQRLFDGDFLRKLARGGFDPVASGRSLLGHLRGAAGARQQTGAARDGGSAPSLAERMAIGCERYRGPVLLIASGRDLTAKEFDDAAAASPRWRRIFAAPRFRRHDLAEADHTFSRRDWRGRVAEWTLAWIRERVADGDGATTG